LPAGAYRTRFQVSQLRCVDLRQLDHRGGVVGDCDDGAEK
jgi:hypothetical protein